MYSRNTTPVPPPSPKIGPSAPASYARVLKQATKSGGTQAPPRLKISPGDIINTPLAIRSYSPYAAVIDFTPFPELDKAGVLQLILAKIHTASTVQFLKHGRTVELGFLSTEARDAFLLEGMQYNGTKLTTYKCLPKNQKIFPVTIRNIPCYTIQDTNHAIQEALSSYGDILDIQYHYYGNTSLRMHSCTVLFGIKPDNDTTTIQLPWQILLFGAPCELWWREAPTFCNYCKKHNHTKSKCPTLQQRRATSLDFCPWPSPRKCYPSQEKRNSIPPVPTSVPPLTSQSTVRFTTPSGKISTGVPSETLVPPTLGLTVPDCMSPSETPPLSGTNPLETIAETSTPAIKPAKKRKNKKKAGVLPTPPPSGALSRDIDTDIDTSMADDLLEKTDLELWSGTGEQAQLYEIVAAATNDKPYNVYLSYIDNSIYTLWDELPENIRQNPTLPIQTSHPSLY